MYSHVFRTAVVGDISHGCKWKMSYLNRTNLNILSPLYLYSFARMTSHTGASGFVWLSLSLLRFTGAPCALITALYF